jgi:hypothetical protein
MPSQTSSTNQSDRRKANKTLLAVAVAIAVVIVAGLLAAFFINNDFHAASTPIVMEIVNGNLTVNASSYASYNFTVPSSAPTATVQGTFTVSGGNGNTIKVYVMDGANLADWQNGLNASMYYDSGELSSGNVTATLPSTGTYYLVYDNTFSATSKNVITQVDFDYIPS